MFLPNNIKYSLIILTLMMSTMFTSNAQNIDQSEYFKHVVKQGETLYSISKLYNVYIDDIKGITPILNIGQILEIPKNPDRRLDDPKIIKNESLKENDINNNSAANNSISNISYNNSNEISKLQNDIEKMSRRLDSCNALIRSINLKNDKILDELNKKNEVNYDNSTSYNISDGNEYTAENSNSEENEGQNEILVFEFGYLGDFVSNFSGGIRQDLIYMGLADIGISFIPENVGLWKNGEVFFHGQSTHGGNATESMIGDFQTLSNIENGNFAYILELLYRQNIGNLSLAIGLHDLNSEFVVSEYGGLYINSSFGIIPSITANIPVSIFPKAGLASVLTYEVSDNITIRGGIYDGDPGSLDDDPHGIDWNLSKDEGYFAIGELQYCLNIDDCTMGTYKVGGYYHSGDFYSADGEGLISGNYGYYGVADQILLPEKTNPENGLGMFIQVGWTPSDRNLCDTYFGGGFNYKGLIFKESGDELGLGVAHANISKDFTKYIHDIYNYETAIELTYKASINENIAIQPDLHYIINTGLDTGLDNAIVGTIRLELTF